MVPRNHVRSLRRPVSAAIITIVLIFSLLICGCLDVEPEELLPQTAVQVAKTTVFPTIQVTVTENIRSVPPPIIITIPKQTAIFTEQDFPPEVENAVSDFAEGKTTD